MTNLHIIQYVGFICAQFTNLVLLVLIYKKAKKLFGSYRHVMFIFTAYSILYTWIEIVALPIIHIHRSQFLLIVDSFLKYDQRLGYYVICLYCASYALCISLLATQFYYRYVVVCRPDKLYQLDGWKLSHVFLPGIIFFFAWYGIVFFGMERTTEHEEFGRQAVFENYGEDTHRIAFIALKFWETDGSFNISDGLTYAGCCSIIAICFSTIVFCASRIYLKLKCEQSLMSEKTRELNRQLLRTLGVQTAVPFFMMYSTVGIILTLPIFEIEVGRKGNIVAALAGVYPAIEPLVAMFFVKDFRRALTCSEFCFNLKDPNSNLGNKKIGSEVLVALHHGGYNSQRSSIAFANKL
ncbi:hypothetical protein CAEBREN_07311 [Caenorhabditis brenneri]|uniref:Serpentine receptor class r-10 n=1 Tax=Caenorhabditis brenneri TaxID=135651 RepID=G0P535_CAEBE|nr:hypothetical protein CAEBREN_07311 [Caenorhabditis brenneri]